MVGLTMKNLNICGVHWKIRFVGEVGGGLTKNQYRGGIARGLARKRVVVFLRGSWYPNAHYEWQKNLGILLGSKLNFDSHITSLCKKKPGQKLSAVARINHEHAPDQKIIAIKLSSNIPIQLLPTDLDV